jgi:hypothetical protein
MEIKKYIKCHGLKICWIADSFGISEELLRYRLKDPTPEFIALFVALIRAHAQAMVEDLKEL